MTDERTHRDGIQPGRYDDDRLLACALELEDDPELLTAAAADSELGARLAVLRADVESVAAQVRAVVPAPDESYTDLSGDRWHGLSGFFDAPTVRARRERRWWRVITPVVTALALALVVGIVAVQNGELSVEDPGDDAEVARSAGEASSLAGPAFTESGADAGPALQTAAAQLAEQLDHFAVVVLARARAATGALQRFAVVRIFKGEAPEVVQLDVDDEPARRGRLHLLMLRPLDTASKDPAPPASCPSPAAAGGDAGYGEPLAVTYTYHGEPTVVREFDADTDPGTVSLPLP